MVIPNQKIELPILTENQVELYVKREDTIHPYVSGNKYRKLKYNLIEAQKRGYSKLLTFGGAFSNHIAAVAFAGKEAGFKTIGVIRGEELQHLSKRNPTLNFAVKNNMHLHFVSREVFRNKTSEDFIDKLFEKFGKCYVLPEGGTNTFAIKGCEEILSAEDNAFNVVCCAVGTGGTIAGISNAAKAHQKVIGFPALKGTFLKDDIRNFTNKENWELTTAYDFGGYAKINLKLIELINDFKKQTNIPLDPIYTGKMVFGILDMIKTGQIEKNNKVLAIHTGGLQGIKGMNIALKKKNLPEIHT